jgi:signal transduction histidine kinase
MAEVTTLELVNPVGRMNGSTEGRAWAGARQDLNHSLIFSVALCRFNGVASALGVCFSQVITNLLTNAIHYNKDGGEIRVTTAVEPASAVLTVVDTGSGIAEDD